MRVTQLLAQANVTGADIVYGIGDVWHAPAVMAFACLIGLGFVIGFRERLAAKQIGSIWWHTTYAIVFSVSGLTAAAMLDLIDLSLALDNRFSSDFEWQAGVLVLCSSIAASGMFITIYRDYKIRDTLRNVGQLTRRNNRHERRLRTIARIVGAKARKVHDEAS